MIQLNDMKFNTLLLAFFFTGILYSQSPAKFSYQSVVRNSQNSIVSNSNVGIRISILQGSITGAIVYMETHSAQTNANGLFTIEIGGGTVQNGNFSNINWGVGPYFTKTEIDPTGGTNYSISGSSQMLSVPYALYAENSGNLLNQWSHGNTAPNINQGTVGDYYLNTITGDVYQKNSTSTWTLISNLMGPQGISGVHGINCWDINNNGINDSSEDINNDGLFNANDCQGPQGLTGAPGTSVGGAPTFILPEDVYLINSEYGFNTSSISVDFDTLIGQHVSVVILYYENSCTSGSSSLPVVCTVNALTNSITYEMIDNYHGSSSGNPYQYGSNSGQIMLPLGPNGIVTFSNSITRSNLKVKIVGYFP
jgi:hypothetical protein